MQLITKAETKDSVVVVYFKRQFMENGFSRKSFVLQEDMDKTER